MAYSFSIHAPDTQRNRPGEMETDSPVDRSERAKGLDIAHRDNIMAFRPSGALRQAGYRSFGQSR